MMGQRSAGKKVTISSNSYIWVAPSFFFLSLLVSLPGFISLSTTRGRFSAALVRVAVESLIEPNLPCAQDKAGEKYDQE